MSEPERKRPIVVDGVSAMFREAEIVFRDGVGRIGWPPEASEVLYVWSLPHLVSQFIA